jgi:hypothetical protein
VYQIPSSPFAKEGKGVVFFLGFMFSLSESPYVPFVSSLCPLFLTAGQSFRTDGVTIDVGSAVMGGGFSNDWLEFKFLFAGQNLSGENRIYAVNQSGQLLSYGDDGTPGNVSAPVTVGFGGG